MGACRSSIQRRYVSPRTVRDPVGKLLWDVAEQFDTVKPVRSWHWFDRENGLYALR